MKTFVTGIEGALFSLTSLGIKHKFGIILISLSDFSVNWNNLFNNSLTAALGAIIGFFVHLILKSLYKKIKGYVRNSKIPDQDQ